MILRYHGYRVPFSAVERSGRGFYQPPVSSAQVKKEHTYTYPHLLDLQGLVYGELYVTLLAIPATIQDNSCFAKERVAHAVLQSIQSSVHSGLKTRRREAFAERSRLPASAGCRNCGYPVASWSPGWFSVSIASVTNPLSTLIQALGRLFEQYAFGRIHTSSWRTIHFSSYISFLCQMYEHVKSELENSFITFDVKINFFSNTIYIYTHTHIHKRGC
jgi:hypothetical protein